MSLGAHLLELRKRLMIAVIGLIIGMIIAFIISGPIINLLELPIQAIEREQNRSFTGLNFDTVTSGFDLRMRIAFAIGLIISAPVWMWQVWAFLMPGLTKKEIRYTIGFVASAIPLFFLGCAVAYFLIPNVIKLLATFVPDNAAQLFKYDMYYDFVFKFFVIVGVAFVLPVFLVALNLAGVVSGRAIIKSWRAAVLISTLFAALATPAADITSMLLLGGIMIVLYFAAAGVALLFDRRRSKRDATLLGDVA